MAGHNDKNGALIEGINVTPLVDITLVLLIIFIVTAKIVVTPTVPLDLPRASHTEQTQVIFSVLLPKGGATLVNGEAVTDDAALSRLAREALANDADLRAVISADGDVPHRRVIQVLDLLKRGGIEHIAFGALSDEAAP
ncbi:MAG: biopolymer transporter ExbD [Myxococcaceae bacterium]|nr:biopolymer transporter ExbD [Myxococcaceae bacterium]